MSGIHMVDYSKKIAIKKIKKLDDGSEVSIGGWAEHLVQQSFQKKFGMH